MPDTCRAKSVTIANTTNKTLIHAGPVFLKQLVCFNSSTTEGVEATVSLYDGLDSTPAATDLQFSTCVPRQIFSGWWNALIDGIVGSDTNPSDDQSFIFEPTASLNNLIKVYNNLIGICNEETHASDVVCPHGAPMTATGVNARSGTVNGILYWLKEQAVVTTPSGGYWAAANLDNITIYDITALFSSFNYINHQSFVTHDDDSEMSYDRNASKVYNFPEPGIYFPHGLVGGALKTDDLTSGTGANTYITCVYQEAAAHHAGGVVKSVYSPGKKSSNPAPRNAGSETLRDGQCIIDSLHIFNDDDDEIGVKILDGGTELARFIAGDNSLTQIYLPKPGIIIKNKLEIEQSSFGNEAPTTIVYREI